MPLPAPRVRVATASRTAAMSLREIRMALEGRREQDEAFKARLSGYTDTIKDELRRRGIPVRTPNMTGIEREMQLRKRLVLALDRGAYTRRARVDMVPVATARPYGVAGHPHVPLCFGPAPAVYATARAMLRRRLTCLPPRVHPHFSRGPYHPP